MHSIRVLFIESDARFKFGLPLGFRDAGHTILICTMSEPYELNNLIKHFKPHLSILMGWSALHTLDNIDTIKEALRNNTVPYVYWATEDPTFTELYSIPLIKRLDPFCIFSVSSQTVKQYIESGYIAHYLPFGYQPSIFKKTLLSHSQYRISLAANAYPNVLLYEPKHFRRRSISLLLNPLIERRIQVDIWGKHWDRMQPYLTYAIPKECLHGPMHYLKTNELYNISDVILGLQNYNSDVLAMRTYEILGSGGFLITSFHQKLMTDFIPGKDFIMIDCEDTTADYVLFYLNHPDARKKIQASGMLSVAQHTYFHRANEMIRRLRQENILSEKL